MSNPIDSVNDFRGPTEGSGLTLQTGLFNQICALTVTSAGLVRDLHTLADSGVYDGHDSTHPDVLAGGAWLVIQPSGSDVYFHVQATNAATNASAANGRLVKDGDLGRVWVDARNPFLDIVSVGASITVKTWFSNQVRLGG